MNRQEKDLDINEIFNEVTSSSIPKEPNSYPLQFELDSLKELFEFLLQFVTMLCKEFYSDDNGQVNLGNMTPEQLEMLKTRNCPDCNTLIKYDNISNKQRADKKNAPCEKCQGEKLSENTRGVRLTKEERDKQKKREIAFQRT